MKTIIKKYYLCDIKELKKLDPSRYEEEIEDLKEHLIQQNFDFAVFYIALLDICRS